MTECVYVFFVFLLDKTNKTTITIIKKPMLLILRKLVVSFVYVIVDFHHHNVYTVVTKTRLSFIDNELVYI